MAAAATFLAWVGPSAAADEFLTFTTSIFGGLSYVSQMTIAPDGTAGAVIVQRASDSAVYSLHWDGTMFSDMTPAGFDKIGMVVKSMISDDGSAAATTAYVGSSYLRAFHWKNGVSTELPFAAGNSLSGVISADGNSIAGAFIPSGAAAGERRGFHWTSTGGIEDLGTLGGDMTAVYQMSRNGAVVIGTSTTTPGLTGTEYPFRWEGGTMTELQMPTGAWGAIPTLISFDGSVIAGSLNDALGNYTAFRWEGGTTEMLPIVAGTSYTIPTAMSADGSLILGYAYIGSTGQGYVWRNGTATLAPSLGGDTSFNSIARDGDMLLGASVDTSGQSHAVVWNENLEIVKFADLLASRGVDLTGWSLEFISSSSDAGDVVAGMGKDALGTNTTWVARCTDYCSFMTPATLGESFAGLGGMTMTGGAYLGSELKAAGAIADANAGAPAGGGGYAYGAYDSDPTAAATVGGVYRSGDGLIAGASVGVAKIVTLMPFGGSSDFAGPAVGAFVASRPETGLQWTLGASVNAVSGTVRRGYLSGNTPVASTGYTSGGGGGVSAEIGYAFAGVIPELTVIPFASITATAVSFAGYTETGGPFPATFAPITSVEAIVRLGVDARYEFAPQSVVAAGLNFAHRFSSNSAVNGTVSGVGQLNVPAAPVPADFLEASIGVELPVADSIDFLAGVTAVVPFGGTPSFVARAGVSVEF